MKFRIGIVVLLVAVAVSIAPTRLGGQSPAEFLWHEPTSLGTPAQDVIVHLYFFWSQTCPHCLDAYPFVEALPSELPWLRAHSHELSRNPANADLYAQAAQAVGAQAQYVPAFIYCGTMTTGYDAAETTGRQLRESLIACHDELVSQLPAPPLAASGAANAVQQAASPEVTTPLPEAPLPAVALPGVTLPGGIDVEGLSLPVMTATIALMDAFNPCAFFVLMFLLSLMVHAHSRKRMALIGGVFVLVSGVVYFAFMAAWLNLFLWIGGLRWITAIAGAVAVGIALVNIKDFFRFKKGISLSIPEQAKPGLFQRMRTLLRAESTTTMLTATIVLALAANSYELLCTSGFPMVFTHILTLHGLPTGTYYAYLLAYNLLYVLPLLLIVTLFTISAQARKLSELEGRLLKLASGLLMLGLGAMLLVAPELLGRAAAGAVLLGATLLITAIAWAIERRREQHTQPKERPHAGAQPKKEHRRGKHHKRSAHAAGAHSR
jgi:hypothetical protein